ncbi:hypothetical protein [Lacticigenium naphthae]|uniref:hypothetical protein n=1 Tax=Lacticigenium naphthae TaxID=515351 RepID=UPI0004152C18|nr:hypothetical protein [Lacticigenium naphthae]
MESGHSIEKTQRSVGNQLDTGQWPVSSAGECPEWDGIETLDRENAAECREPVGYWTVASILQR